MTNLYQDEPTEHRVVRNGAKRRVWARYFDGEFIRYFLKRNQRDIDHVRYEVYRGAVADGKDPFRCMQCDGSAYIRAEEKHGTHGAAEQ